MLNHSQTIKLFLSGVMMLHYQRITYELDKHK